MSSPSTVQIKSTASPGPLNLSAITSAPDTPLPSAENATPTLPPASLFTFLPDLYVLISRLSDLRNPPQDANTQDSLTQTISRDSNASLRQVSSSEKAIDIKDLPGHVFGLKKRILEAKEVVTSLEDGSRTIQEQEADMERLRGRIVGYRKRLRELGAICGGNEKGDVVMEGVEEKG